MSDPPILSSVAQVPQAIVDALTPLLDEAQHLPPPAVGILYLSSRSVGLGGLRGLEPRRGFGDVELRGGRVEAAVRFQVWGEDFDAANGAMLTLQGRILEAQPTLVRTGLLELEGIAGTLPAEVESEDAWARTADYRILFEYVLAPAVSEGGLITRIPVESIGEVAGASEQFAVTGELVRWDQDEAEPLLVRGRRSLGRLRTASFIPGPQPSGGVTLLRTHDQSAGSPTVFASLADFLTGVSGPGAPAHAAVTFSSLTDFLALFVPADPMTLGDWDEDGVPDSYQVGELALVPPLVLPSPRDRMEISLETAPLDQVGVVYLRAAGSTP